MRRLITTITVAGAAVLLTGCNQRHSDQVNQGELAGDYATDASSPSAVASELSGDDFANRLAASDAFEIASSKLAKTRASSADVKAFARKMIAAHTASSKELVTVSKRLKPPINPSPVLSVDQRHELAALQELKGSEFDLTYLSDQIAAHQSALDVLQSYSKDGEVPAFKSLAESAAMTVSSHLDQARKLNSVAVPG